MFDRSLVSSHQSEANEQAPELAPIAANLDGLQASMITGNHNGNGNGNQLQQYALPQNVQPHDRFPIPTFERPSAGSYDSGLSRISTGYNSTPKAPTQAPPSFPATFSYVGQGQDECLAIFGLECECRSCKSPFAPTSNSHFDSNLFSNLGPTQNLKPSSSIPYGSNTNSPGSSLFMEEPPDLSYSKTIDTSSFPTAYSSAPVSFGRQRPSSNPSTGWLGYDNSSIGRLDHSGGSLIYQDDMRKPPPNASQRVHAGQKPTQNYLQSKARPQRRTSSSRQHAPQSTNKDWTLSCDDFIKAQKVFREVLKDEEVVSNTLKSSLVNILKMPAAQLELCLQAKRDLEPVLRTLSKSSLKVDPVLNALSGTAQDRGLPLDYIARWFNYIHETHLEKALPLDSTYHSLDVVSPTHVLERPKKKRKLSRISSIPKPYQCTFYDKKGNHCPQTSSNITDWKRHEEIHWPHRDWECLIEEGSTSICHVCGQLVSQNPDEVQATHRACFDRRPRRSHTFSRKDKLKGHMKDVHGYESNLDAWNFLVQSSWKTRCGFCGKTFSDRDWDERCAHVGPHFAEGMRMDKDWKDPWPTPDKPDDDDDDNDDDDGDDNDPSDGAGDAPDDSHQDDMDADGEDDPDYDPAQDHRLDTRRKDSGDSSQQRNGYSGADNNDWDRGSNRTRGGVTHTSNDRSSHAQERSCRQSTTIARRNLNLGPLSDIHGPGGDSKVFKSVGQLGSGTFGLVDEVEHTGTQRHYARKSLRGAGSLIGPAFIQAQREVAALRKLRHVHIVSLLASYSWEDQFSIIISPVADCTLSEYIQLNMSVQSRFINLAKWVGCLVSAVSYMHRQSCQHLDIKPSNILIAGDQVMLSDFGGAVVLDGSESRQPLGRGCAVTPMYCAPEIACKQKRSYVPGASDVYSLGCVFLEMITVIYRESLQDFEHFRASGSKDATYHRNSRKSSIWIDHLREIDSNLGLPVKDSLWIIHNMLSDDWMKRPTAHAIENTFQSWHLQTKWASDQKNYLISTQTETSFDPLDIVKQWLHGCLDTHTNCPGPDRSFSPSRILNIGEVGDTIRLDNDPTGPYVALSHCWGTTAPLKTTSRSLDSMFKGIPVGLLSRTFLDAIRVTRRLGFRYLWIDALCIIQDSLEDLSAQVSSMHRVFSNSILTICVADSTQPKPTRAHKMLEHKPGRRAERAPCSTCDRKCRLFEPLTADTSTTMLLDSSWSQRGWTLQERILSPRILYYSSTRLAWECHNERLSLDRVTQIRQNLKSLGSGTLSIPNKQEADPSVSLVHGFRKTWRDIVREYSRRFLTYPEDKLPALAGMASKMASMSCQSYVAGLWEGDLINDLLWCRDFATVPISRPEYRAPSWSWASIDSPILWPKCVNYSVEKNAQVVDCRTVVKDKISPFAGVSDGYVRIRGLAREAVVMCSRNELVLDRSSLERIAFAHRDALCTTKTKDDAPRLDEPVIEELLCLQILTHAGLLLRERKEYKTKTFERVGIYWNNMNKVLACDGVVEDSKEPVLDKRWKVATITIV